MVKHTLEQAVLDRWTEIIPLIEVLQSRTAERGQFVTLPNSELALDDALCRAFPVSHGFHFGLIVAADHMHAAKALVVDAGVLHVGAPSSLARGAIEGASTALWLLQPVERADRVLRALRWFAQNAIDQDKSVRAHVPRPLHEVLNDIRSAADKAGVDPTVAARGFRQTEVIQSIAAEWGHDIEFAWRLCSGFAHGRPWAYLGALEQERLDDEQPGYLNVKLTNSNNLALFPHIVAFNLVSSLLVRWEQLAGYR